MVGGTLLYLLWLPCQSGFIRLLTLGTSHFLALVEQPPVITGLTSSGNVITIYSYLSGRHEPIATWDAANLHIFVVASLALLLAAPWPTWRLRARGLGVALAGLVTLLIFITTAQLKTVAETYARQYLNLTLHTSAEYAILSGVNRAVMVGMLLLPALLFLAAYLSFRTEPTPHENTRPRSESAPRRPPLPSHRNLPAWIGLGSIAAFWVLLLAWPMTQPTPRVLLEGLQRLVALNPNSSQAHFSLGFHHEASGRLQLALESYRTALRLDPDRVSAHYNLGNVWFKKGEFLPAARSYEEVLKRDENHLSARQNLGNTYYERGLLDQAREIYEEVLTRSPDRAFTHKNLGETLLRLEHPCEALVQFEASARLDGRLGADSSLQARIASLRDRCNPGGN